MKKISKFFKINFGKRDLLVSCWRGVTVFLLLIFLSNCGGGGGGSEDSTPNPSVGIGFLGELPSVGREVRLDATKFFVGQGGLVYFWEVIDAPVGAIYKIDDHAISIALFTGDMPGLYEVRVTVSNVEGEVRSESVSFELQNSKPVANAGEDIAADVFSLVQLDGTSSTDRDGQVLEYNWTFLSKPSGSSAVFDSTAAATPSFSVDMPGEYRISLTVSDGFVDSDVDVVSVSTNNIIPVAHAGTNVSGKLIGDTVILDGTQSSDLDGDVISFSWSFKDIPEGSNVSFDDDQSSKPSFVIDKKGQYSVQLVVSDGKETSAPSIVLVNVENTGPVANAGLDRSVPLGERVRLSGELSNDIDGDSLIFYWNIIQAPEGSTPFLNSQDTLFSEATLDIPGLYVIQLAVFDGELEDLDTVTINVEMTDFNIPPVANAGEDVAIRAPGVVFLDGVASFDGDGEVLTYQWSIIDKPNGSNAELAGSDGQVVGLSVDIAGIYGIQLVVNDGRASSAPDSVIVSLNVNSKPIANAGIDQANILGEPIRLDGRASHDLDFDELSFAWAVSGPQGSQAELDDVSSSQPFLTVDSVGEYLIQLIVSDGEEDSLPDTSIISIIDGDQDADGLLSSIEMRNGLNPNVDDSDNNGVIDSLEDLDRDGLNNMHEVLLGYEILNADSDGDEVLDGDEDADGDGYSNLVEINSGSDPLDENSVPRDAEMIWLPSLPLLNRDDEVISLAFGWEAHFSLDGAKVVFSTAVPLLPEDTNSSVVGIDVYLYDVESRGLSLVSVPESGVQPSTPFRNIAPRISPDGTKVLFVSSSAFLVAGDSNGVDDLFVKDMVTGKVDLLSKSSSGELGNLRTFEGAFLDNQRVLIVTDAQNLVDEYTTNRGRQYYVKSLVDGSVEHIKFNGLDGNIPRRHTGSTEFWNLSEDGSYFVFSSNISSIIDGDANEQYDIYLYDFLSKDTSRVSTDSDNSEIPNEEDATRIEGAIEPRITFDGSRVAFISSSSRLVENDTNSTADLFVKNLSSGIIDRINVRPDGGEAAFLTTVRNPRFSPDGSKIAFWHVNLSGHPLIDGVPNGAVLYVKDLNSGELDVVSRDIDGNYVSFSATPNIFWGSEGIYMIVDSSVLLFSYVERGSP